MQVVLVKARLHDFVYVFDWNLLKENFVKSIPFTPSKFGQSFYPKLRYGGNFKHKQNGCIRSWFRKDVLIGQFPSMSVKVFG